MGIYAGNTTNANMRIKAEKAPFEAFGILYYPLPFDQSSYDGIALDDQDLTWAMTAATNLDGSGYMLSTQGVEALAAAHHLMNDISVNPLADIMDLVPDVHAAPMYPDFPSQVMELSEAQFRYHQAMHYMSTYGVELVAGLLGLNVTVGEGWLPDVPSTEKDERDERLARPNVLHVITTREGLLSVVTERIARATRMHPAEIETALMVIDGEGDEIVRFPTIGFHENMMEIIKVASLGTSAQLREAIMALAQHPGDILQATMMLVGMSPKRHLATRQKKAICAALEQFPAHAIARNAVDNGKPCASAMAFLSVSRFGGPHLRHAHRMVETHTVRSWNSELESAWSRLPEDGFSPILAKYGERPGVLMRSLTRLVKAGCPMDDLLAEVLRHTDAYSLPTIVRNLTIMGIQTSQILHTPGSGDHPQTEGQHRVYEAIVPILFYVLRQRLEKLDTPLRNKRVFIDKGGISAEGSVLIPNDTGNTGTAWPPVGIAYEIPTDKRIRFFTFWDDRDKRVDVDLHFIGMANQGGIFHIGWNGSYNTNGMVMSGDITTSHDSVEYLDIDMAVARSNQVECVVQKQHIYAGARDWNNIATCFSGATLVSNTDTNVTLMDRANLLFRDDLTGEGNMMDYALISISDGWVRILRGMKPLFHHASFNLGTYLQMLLDAQGTTQVDNRDEADVVLCLGRSENEGDISLFDSGYFIG